MSSELTNEQPNYRLFRCTSRQKIQAGKRNLGVAEFEYLRLFEQERLSTNTGNNSETYDSSLTRSSSADLSTNTKVEQMLEQFGIIDPQVFQSVSLLNVQDTQTFEANSPSDSDSTNTTANPSLNDTANMLSKSPPSFGPLAALSNQMDPRQLMFALSQFNQELRNVTSLNASVGQSKDNESMVNEEKEKQQLQTSPPIKRPLEDGENLMKMFTVKKKKSNGIFGNQQQNGDERWKREMLEVTSIIIQSIITSISAPTTNPRESNENPRPSQQQNQTTNTRLLKHRIQIGDVE